MIRVNEYYRQATRYYENFRQLETEMNLLSENNEVTISDSFNLIDQLKSKLGNSEALNLVDEL